jgi:hypothetical protein
MANPGEPRMKIIRQCTEIIGVIERGDAAHDLTLEIEKVVKACQDAAGPKTKAKGQVILKLDFEVEDRFIEIKADISSKVPKLKRGSTAYFLTQDGQITTEHPSQKDMFDGPRDTARAS